MGTRSFRTLGDIVNKGYVLHVQCAKCGRKGDFSPEGLYGYFRGARALETLRFVCSKDAGGCGSRRINLAIREIATAARRRHGWQPMPRPLDDGRR